MFRLPVVDLLVVNGTNTERHRNHTNSGATLVQMIHPEKGKKICVVGLLCFLGRA
jgi:hypothetical protein